MSETPRSALALAALATVAIPGLDVIATRPPRHPGADFDVVRVLDADQRRWVVRAPRVPAAGAALEAEVSLLSVLGSAVDGGRLPFDVPKPAGFAPLPEGGRAMVYRELGGNPLDVATLAHGPGLAANVGRAIAALHELDAASLAEAGLPSYDADSYRRRRLAEVDEAAGTGYVPATLLRRWEHALEDVALWRFRATPVHGDLAAEHVLVAGGKVIGILDWSAARIADPADDLAWLLSTAPDEALDSILESYALGRTEYADDHLADRAILASELALVRWLMHGVRARDGEIIDQAIDMLQDLEADVADAGPIGRTEPVMADWPDQDIVENVPGENEADQLTNEIPYLEPDESSGAAPSLTGDEIRVGEDERPHRGDDETPTAQLPPYQE